MNEEIQESSRETEVELREELDMTKGKVAEYQLRLRQMQEDISDRQETIAKFRQAMETLKVSTHFKFGELILKVNYITWCGSWVPSMF